MRRVPRHVRAAKRNGARDQLVSESVSLHMPDGTEYSPKEADSRIVDIVGLTKSQFMQVAMITQGEFMELLRTDSNRKKEIFRRLFHTGMYQDIVDELAQRCRDMRSSIAQIRTAFQQEASHILVPETYSHREEINGPLRRILTADRLSAADMETLLSELQLLCDGLQAETKSASEEAAALGTRRDAVRDAVTAAEALARSYSQLSQAQQDLAACESSREEISSTERRIRQISDAWDIRTVWQRYEDAKKTAAKTAADLEREKISLPALKEAAGQADKREADAKAAADQALARYAREKERTDKSLQILQQILTAEKKSPPKKLQSSRQRTPQKRLSDGLPIPAPGSSRRPRCRDPTAPSQSGRPPIPRKRPSLPISAVRIRRRRKQKNRRLLPVPPQPATKRPGLHT